MAISIAMLALKQGRMPPPDAIQRELNAVWPELGPMTQIEQDEVTLGFHLGDSDVILGHMPAPIPWSDLEGPCATSWLWPESEASLRDHDSHLIVTVASPDSRSPSLSR